MLMNCYSVSGDGKEYDQGTWEVRMKQKTASFTCANVPTVFADYRPGETIKIHMEKPGRHTPHDWGDGTYTVYTNRSGKPYVFHPATPISPENDVNA